MTKYREILRLHSRKLSQQKITDSYSVSKKTVNSVIKKVKEKNIFWSLDDNTTDEVLAEVLFLEKGKHITEASIKCLTMLTFARNNYVV